MHRSISAALLALCAGPALAVDGITDRVGDFLPTFGGSTAAADLDVVAATVTYNTATDTFTFASTMAGNLGITPSGLFVWGVNRGAGTAGFFANGLPGVLFDRVVLLREDGTGTVAGTNLPAGAITISGNTITGVVSGALLPSTGFAKTAYTFNLWPRDGSLPAGFGQISDFAPDNANFTATVVPEPASFGLLAAGLAGIGLLRRRRGNKALSAPANS